MQYQNKLSSVSSKMKCTLSFTLIYFSKLLLQSLLGKQKNMNGAMWNKLLLLYSSLQTVQLTKEYQKQSKSSQSKH